MTTFEIRKATALQALKKAGISRSDYLPPALKLLWRLGFKSPPPHFANSGWVVFVAGSYFAVTWGMGMLLIGQFLHEFQMPVFPNLTTASFSAGVLFGIAMASYYACGRRKHKLPKWESLA